MVTTKKKTSAEPAKMTPAQMRKRMEALEEEVRAFKEDTAWCYLCGKPKRKDKFYVSTDPRVKSGLTPICKECSKELALRTDKNNEDHEPTVESAQLALRYLNKPFIHSLWDSSIQESENLANGKVKTNPWYAYTKNVAMGQYNGLTYFDSDMFKERVVYDDEKTPEDVINNHTGQDTYDDYLKNKSDVVRLLSYDPFEKEAISDQPFLYSQLLGILDASEDANDDMMRVSSAISIVRGFLQQSKIDDTIAKLMGDISKLEKNSATIKSLQDSKSKLTGIIKDLAAESCISLKNNKNAKKGENTWTGKIKKIKDMNLREGEVNGFDIGTCRGMRQVMDMSNASIIKQLRLDESEYSDMLADQREMITKLQSDLDNYKEISRILLRENIDLKDFIEENNISFKDNLVDLNELFSCFSSLEEENEVDEDGNDDESESTEA